MEKLTIIRLVIWYFQILIARFSMSTLLSSVGQLSSLLDFTAQKGGAKTSSSVAFVLPADDTISTTPDPSAPSAPVSVPPGPGNTTGGLGAGKAGLDTGIYDYAGITLLIPGGSVDDLSSPIASDPTAATAATTSGSAGTTAVTDAQPPISNGLTPISSAPSPITAAPSPIASAPAPITTTPSPISSVLERVAMNYSAVGANISGLSSSLEVNS
ncbi:hypothetical protein HNR60_003323 [Rhodopseudomonas rhenobacensis]|uniref:Uncharacterized protein n=1 Tax=Rhodopseudomonas rhenobacensis TaxID=87461 RepID=A0A7W7Z5W3_9BRAD|nr:hypothetical protein [Rhodopseudomonas rhenobacensis]MBB5048556.1 hypothetical protein [Rhodopseudomonas rhenobacensis]